MKKNIGIVMVGCICMITGCAVQMKISDKQMGSNRASLEIKAPELRKWYTMVARSVDVTLSKFQGCDEDQQKDAKLHAIGHATLTTVRPQQSTDIPGETDLALYIDSMAGGGGLTTNCEMALRFTSEPGRHYVLAITPQKYWTSTPGHHCEMDVVLSEVHEGTERSVTSVRYAVAVYHGFFKGTDLQFCRR